MSRSSNHATRLNANIFCEALKGDSENTPLQLKLNELAELIAKLGSAAGLLLFAVLMIKFFVQLKTESHRFGILSIINNIGSDQKPTGAEQKKRYHLCKF